MLSSLFSEGSAREGERFSILEVWDCPWIWLLFWVPLFAHGAGLQLCFEVRIKLRSTGSHSGMMNGDFPKDGNLRIYSIFACPTVQLFSRIHSTICRYPQISQIVIHGSNAKWWPNLYLWLQIHPTGWSETIWSAGTPSKWHTSWRSTIKGTDFRISLLAFLVFPVLSEKTPAAFLSPIFFMYYVHWWVTAANYDSWLDAHLQYQVTV